MTSLPLPGIGVERWADLSDDGLYRWELGVIWNRRLPPLGAVGLNPSTADADTDDASSRRWIGFARRDGFGGLLLGNLYSWRSTDPRGLLTVTDPIGWRGTAVLADIADRCNDVLLSWGRLARPWMRHRADDVTAMFRRYGTRLCCLGTTKHGYPRHPLYVPADQEREPYPLPLRERP